MDREFCIAWADGNLDGEEAEMLRDFVEDASTLSDADKQEYSRYFTEPYTGQSRADALNALKKTIKTQDQIHHIIYSLRKMICADGEVDDGEQVVYESIRKELQAIALKLKTGKS